jgi:hypothetical protein
VVGVAGPIAAGASGSAGLRFSRGVLASLGRFFGDHFPGPRGLFGHGLELQAELATDGSKKPFTVSSGTVQLFRDAVERQRDLEIAVGHRQSQN